MQNVEARVEEILARMTLSDKIGQLRQCSASIVGAFEVPFEELIAMMTDGRITPQEFQNLMETSERDYHEDELARGQIGSFNGGAGAEKTVELQKKAMSAPAGVPLLIGQDVIHGQKTVYPIPLAESCAWDPEIWEKTAAVAAKEARAMGVNWTFSPMLDIARDARWGRIAEGAGEDPVLASAFARAKVHGYQGDDPSDPDKILACGKHFVAYGAAEAGRDYNTTDMSMQKLYEVYLPPFKAAVEAGLQTIMPAFNDLNGVPCSQNEFLLTDVLRKQWGFDGMTISDANAIRECIAHGASEDELHAGANCLNAGMDMDMGTDIYFNLTEEAVQKGLVSEETINERVRNILRVKLRAGLFDNVEYTSAEREAREVLDPAYRPIVREAALHSTVLLKNDGVLPLAKNADIAVAGELADRRDEVIGTWAPAAECDVCVSILDGIRAYQPDVPFCKGETDEEIAALAKHDVIVAVVGETRDMSGEASSRGDISIRQQDKDLLWKLHKTCRKIVAVLMNGRPLTLPWENEHLNAIVEGWHGGTEMGSAIAQILFGDFNPCGKLTATFPYAVGQCPIYYNHPSTGRPGATSKFTSRYLDIPFEPLFPFGYGLSYTSFAYGGLTAAFEDGNLKLSFTLENTGKVAGTEIAQVYVQDVTAERVRPVKELKAWRKLTLAPGEKQTLEFTIPVSELGYYHNDMTYSTDPGLFRIHVGGNSRDVITAEATL